MSNYRELLIAIALIPIATSCEKTVQKVESKPRPVRWSAVGSGAAGDARAFSASIQARDATQLSFRVGGTLAKLNVKMGEQVKKGQLIASLDESDYKVQLAQARANYQNAKTQRDTARSNFRRVEKLYEASSASLSDYDNAKGQLKSAEAQLSAAGQQVTQAKNQLNYTKLRAAFDGVANAVNVKAGEQVPAGSPIAVISKGGELEVSVGVPEGVIARIKVGTVANVTVAALSDAPLPGKVREVGFASQNSTFPVRITLDAPPAELRPGMAATAEFDLGTRTASLVVPVAAVGNTEGGSFVFALDAADGELYKVRKQKVVLGELIGDSFELKEGLKPGDKVATAGLSILLDGMTVRLLESSEPQPPEQQP